MDKLVEELTGIETALTTLQAQVEFSRFNIKILKYVFHSSPHSVYKYFFRKITFVDYDFKIFMIVFFDQVRDGLSCGWNPISHLLSSQNNEL